jgi:hypothetical protein
MSIPIVLKGGVLVTNGTTLATDSFGVTKMAQAFPLFASMSCRGSNVLGMDQTPNEGTEPPAAPVANTSWITFSNAGETASTYSLYAARISGGHVTAARQGYVYTSYIPGIGKQAMFTGILKFSASGISNTTDVKQAYTRLGLGNATSGLFWQYDAHTDKMYVAVQRENSYTSYIQQSDFNGNNLSAVTVPAETGYGTFTDAINWGKIQLFYIDYEWLGAGCVRFGVMIDDNLIVAHTVTNFNALTAPYLTIPNLPARYEATVRSPATGILSALEGCCSVSINTAPTWPPQTNTSLTYVSSAPFTYNVGTAQKAVLAIRGQQGGTPSNADGARSSLTLTSVSIVLTSSDNVLLRVYRCFVRSGVTYGVVDGTSVWSNPYPLLPAASSTAPACLAEIRDPTILVGTPLATGTLTLDAVAQVPPRAPQLLVASAATSATRFGSVSAQAICGCSMDTTSVPTIFIVTAQNLNGNSFTGVCILEWSQES